MYIYNQKKMKEVLDIFNENDYETLCKKLFLDNRELNRKGALKYIGQGADRVAFLIPTTDIVVKIAANNLLSYDNSYDEQGITERCTYELMRDTGTCCEFYGAADNGLVLFCEYLESAEEVETYFNHPEALDYLLEEYAGCLEEFADGEYDEDNPYDAIANFLQTIEGNVDFIRDLEDYNDLHLGNIGIDQYGCVKVLDLGFGSSTHRDVRDYICKEIERYSNSLKNRKSRDYESRY